VGTGVLLYKLCYYTTPFEEQDHWPIAYVRMERRRILCTPRNEPIDRDACYTGP